MPRPNRRRFSNTTPVRGNLLVYRLGVGIAIGIGIRNWKSLIGVDTDFEPDTDSDASATFISEYNHP